MSEAYAISPEPKGFQNVEHRDVELAAVNEPQGQQPPTPHHTSLYHRGDDNDKLPPFPWPIWLFGSTLVSSIFELILSSYQLYTLNSERTRDGISPPTATTQFLVAVSVLSVMATSYGILHHLRISWVMKYLDVRYSWQMIIITAKQAVLWLSAAAAHSAWVNTGTWYDGWGNDVWLTDAGHDIGAALASFGFLIFIKWTILAVAAGMYTRRALAARR